MSVTYEQALKEAMRHVEKNVVIYETFEFSHESKGSSFWVVNSGTSLIAQLETGVQATFDPIAMKFTDPSKSDQGFPEISIVIGNVDRIPSDYVEDVLTSGDPLYMTFRRYMSTDLTKPSQSPLKLTVKDVKVTAFEVTIRCTIANVKSKKFLSQLYTRNRFPSIGD